MNKFPIPEGYHWQNDLIVMRTESESGVPQAHRVADVHDVELFDKFLHDWVQMRLQTTRIADLMKPYGT